MSQNQVILFGGSLQPEKYSDDVYLLSLKDMVSFLLLFYSDLFLTNHNNLLTSISEMFKNEQKLEGHN